MTHPKRGEVFLVRLNPTVGKEIKKTRPAVVVQNNISNQYSPFVIVCPITSTLSMGLTRVLVKSPQGGLNYDSVVLTQQIRSIDKKRLVKKLGTLNKKTMKEVNTALKITIGLLPI